MGIEKIRTENGEFLYFIIFANDILMRYAINLFLFYSNKRIQPDVLIKKLSAPMINPLKLLSDVSLILKSNDKFFVPFVSNEKIFL